MIVPLNRLFRALVKSGRIKPSDVDVLQRKLSKDPKVYGELQMLWKDKLGGRRTKVLFRLVQWINANWDTLSAILGIGIKVLPLLLDDDGNPVDPDAKPVPKPEPIKSEDDLPPKPYHRGDHIEKVADDLDKTAHWHRKPKDVVPQLPYGSGPETVVSKDSPLVTEHIDKLRKLNEEDIPTHWGEEDEHDDEDVNPENEDEE